MQHHPVSVTLLLGLRWKVNILPVGGVHVSTLIQTATLRWVYLWKGG